MEGSGRAEDDTDKNRSRAGGAGYTDADKWGQHVTTDQKSMSVRTLEISKDKDKNLFIRTKARPESGTCRVEPQSGLKCGKSHGQISL